MNRHHFTPTQQNIVKLVYEIENSYSVIKHKIRLHRTLSKSSLLHSDLNALTMYEGANAHTFVKEQDGARDRYTS